MSRLVVRRDGRQLSIPDDWSIEAEGSILLAADDLHVIFDADDLNNCGGWLLLTLDAEGRIVRPSNYGATMQTSNIHAPHKIVKSYLNEMDGTIVIVRQYPSNMAYTNGTVVPDRVVKETYGIVDGRIGLIQTQEGVHKPSYIVPESVEFPS